MKYRGGANSKKSIHDTLLKQGSNGMRAELKIYRGEEAYSEKTFSSESPTVNVRLSEMTRAIADAVHWNRTWLHDFMDDDIQVPSDLYEVITAYNHLRPSA